MSCSGVALRATEAYAGEQLQYEGRRGARYTPAASDARQDLGAAGGSVSPTRALRLSGREGFFVGTSAQPPDVPTFLQWCARRRSEGQPVWGCGLRALREYVLQMGGR